MLIIPNILEAVPDYPIGYRIGMIILVILCMSPWIALIFYAIFKKYRIRFFDGNQMIMQTNKYKAGQDIMLPQNTNIKNFHFEGWYRDETFEIPFEITKMPKENLKVYGKWVKKENEEI